MNSVHISSYAKLDNSMAFC